MLGWLGFPYHPLLQIYISLERRYFIQTYYNNLPSILQLFNGNYLYVYFPCTTVYCTTAIFYFLSPSYASILSFVSRFPLTINSKLSQKLRISVSRTHHVEVFALCPTRSLLDGNLARCNFPFVMAHFTALTSDHS